MRWLQAFDFRKSPYERPNQKWVCGHRRQGEGCELGPDRRGRCRTTAECAPRRDGAVWVCTRSKAAGGSCAEGPGPTGACGRPVVPCQPVRSVRARRGKTVRWAAALTVGLLALAVFGGDAARWIAPGPLTAHHAELQDCATCHEGFDAGPEGWLDAALSGVPEAREGDSAQCLTCHDSGQKPFNPHGLPSGELAGITEALSPPAQSGTQPTALSLARQSFAPPHKATTGLACADCHGEHQGVRADLTAMSDGQCQVCHVDAFRAFEAGHPEIEGFAFDRRTRINFDHVSHLQKHFPEADDPPAQCGACHTTAEGGGVMRTKSFETACATCHTGDVRGTKAAGSPGVPVLTVPGLDLVTLREKGVGIGEWPETADRELTPFMRAMLAGDEATRAALRRFRGLDPLDLRDASEADLQAVRTVAWGVKGLVFDLIAEGPAELQPALSRALGQDIDAGAASRLMAGLPLGTLREGQKAWFPDLAAEMAAHRAGENVPIPPSEFAEAAAAEVSEGGGATGDDKSDILGDGSDEASGDDILGEDEDSASGGDLLGGGSDEASGDDILGGDEDSAGGGDILGGDEDSAGDGDLLGGGSDEASGDGLLSVGEDSADEDAGILSGGDATVDDGGGLLGGGGEDDAEAKAAERAATETAEMPRPQPDRWARLGGWYRDYFAVSYRPQGHADIFAKGWIDAATGAAGGPEGALGTALMARVGTPEAPGRCVKCHSIDRTASGVTANWHARRPVAETAFTTFRHEPHLTRVRGDEGCATCHSFVPGNDYEAGFSDWDPATFASNFEPIGKDDCTTCHVEDKAGNACTQCHNYHVGVSPDSGTATRLDDMAMSGEGD